MNLLLLWRAVALIGLLGLIFLIIIWNGWLTPIQKIPRSLEMLILLTPLMFFVRGLLNGSYTRHVQAAFPALFYFLIGVWYGLTPQEEKYGYLMALFSSMLYLGGALYARSIVRLD